LTVNFTNKSEGTAFKWDFGDGSTSTDNSPSHTYSQSGEFDVTLIAFNANGCSDTLKKVKYIKIKKPVIKFIDLPTNGCIPYDLHLNQRLQRLIQLVLITGILEMVEQQL
jgi:PKD repeat protein